MVALYNMFNYVDILSFPPEMKIKGHSRFTTNLGILFSMICMMTILIISSSIIIDVFSRKKFSLIYNLDNRETPKVKLNETQTALILFDALGNELLEHERYYNFMVKYWRIEVPNNYFSQTNTTDYK